MGKSEREMLTSVGINLLILYRNDTAGMGQSGVKIPKHPGMVVRNLATGRRFLFSDLAVNLFILYGYNTAGMAECGFMVPGHPGMVVGNLAAGG